MAERSDRNKVRLQIELAAGCLDKALQHVKNAGDILQERSVEYDDNAPILVGILEQTKQCILDFRALL